MRSKYGDYDFDAIFVCIRPEALLAYSPLWWTLDIRRSRFRDLPPSVIGFASAPVSLFVDHDFPKEQFCKELRSRGHIVFENPHEQSVIPGVVSLDSRVIYDAYMATSYPNQNGFLYAARYGMKSKLRPYVFSTFDRYTFSSDTRLGETIYDIGKIFKTENIWVFRRAVQSKKQYKVLDKLGGLDYVTVQFTTSYSNSSDKWPLIDVEYTFYFRLRHVIKALSSMNFSVATTRSRFRQMLDNFTLHTKLCRVKEKDVGGYRIECRFRVQHRSSPSIREAVDWLLARDKFNLDSYPDLSFRTVKFADYLSLTDTALKVAEKLPLASGDNRNALPKDLSNFSAYLINLFGETYSHAQQLFDKGREAYHFYYRIYNEDVVLHDNRPSSASHDAINPEDLVVNTPEPDMDETSRAPERAQVVLDDDLALDLYRRVL
ncbi:hypothetical protein FOL47_000527 [Perkinsus chesapeaki]|uniref:Uncharacterized protein n=1 Tax=Perkinsus chesapeaki TaxID=330153 RepID=A0A7J6KWG0_PERCH|nr:hypothetical protein FOL47_000527 [Perkinsus chesapeaki]